MARVPTATPPPVVGFRYFDKRLFHRSKTLRQRLGRKESSDFKLNNRPLLRLATPAAVKAVASPVATAPLVACLRAAGGDAITVGSNEFAESSWCASGHIHEAGDIACQLEAWWRSWCVGWRVEVEEAHGPWKMKRVRAAVWASVSTRQTDAQTYTHSPSQQRNESFTARAPCPSP